MTKKNPTKNCILDQAAVVAVLDYDPVTGIFRRKISVGQWRAGDIAGSINEEGYRTIHIDGKRYRAARVAWIITYGYWPKNLVDHRNNIRDDDCIENLREATLCQNRANSKRTVTNTSGYKGVSWDKKYRKWRARIKHQNIQINLGQFITPDEAYAAYCNAAAILHGQFSRIS